MRVLVAGMGLPAFVLIASLFSTEVRTQSAGRELYVAPNGLGTNEGSLSQPLDLQTALSAEGPAQPGDTIWLRGGTYRGTFTSTLTGTASAPIVVRQYPGERAIIDSAPSPRDALTAQGAYTWFWGFEIMSSDPQRVSNETGSWPSDLGRGYGVYATGTSLKLINLIVHDMGNGLGLWTEAADTEAYGNIVFYNGWSAPDRAHGHGIYTQNRTGTRRVTDNIVFDQFSHGVHAYGSDAAWLDNIRLEGNIVFHSGTLGADPTRDILLGGGRVAQSPFVSGNATYGLAQVNVGYGAGCSDGTVTDNDFVGSGLLLVACTPTLTGNRAVSIYGSDSLPPQSPGNSWFPAPARPASAWVRVRPNRYEPGRAHVAVYNWNRLPAIDVDLSASGLQTGDAFEIRHVQNLEAPPVASGTYDGRVVSVPMAGPTVRPPVGNVTAQPQPAGPEFGAFLVVRTSGGGSTPPPPTPPPPASTAPAAPTHLRIVNSSSTSTSSPVP